MTSPDKTARVRERLTRTVAEAKAAGDREAASCALRELSRLESGPRYWHLRVEAARMAESVSVRSAWCFVEWADLAADAAENSAVRPEDRCEDRVVAHREALEGMARYYQADRSWDSAAKQLEKLASLYPNRSLAAACLLRLAEIQRDHLDDPEAAAETSKRAHQMSPPPVLPSDLPQDPYRSPGPEGRATMPWDPQPDAEKARPARKEGPTNVVLANGPWFREVLERVANLEAQCAQLRREVDELRGRQPASPARTR